MKLNKFEKLMVLNAAPIKQVFNYSGGAIGMYFLWDHDWISALVYCLGIVFLGSILAAFVFRYKAEKVADSFSGKAYLRFSTPIGFSLYLASHILIPFSFWTHNLYFVALGLALFIAGYIFGSKKY